MVSKIKGLFALALVAVAGVGSYASAAQTYDFSSSTEETGALVTALGGAGLNTVLSALPTLFGIALILMGIAWVWYRFKRFSGMGKKI